MSERIHNTLTVEELIKELQQQNPKSPVYVNDTMEYVLHSVSGVTGGGTMSCDETKTPLVLIEI
jgi:hypothetical protein